MMVDIAILWGRAALARYSTDRCKLAVDRFQRQKSLDKIMFISYNKVADRLAFDVPSVCNRLGHFLVISSKQKKGVKIHAKQAKAIWF